MGTQRPRPARSCRRIATASAAAPAAQCQRPSLRRRSPPFTAGRYRHPEDTPPPSRTQLLA
eukprot:1288989-Prymnesium_polylepis.1